MDFQCSSKSGLDLCFNGGNCSTSSGGDESCVCPLPYQPDLARFHFPNCVLYNNEFYTYYVATLGSLALVLLLLTLAWILPRATPAMRGLAIYLALYALNQFLHKLSLYLEQGCFEACSFFETNVYWIIMLVLQKMGMMLIKPLMSFRIKTKMTKIIQYFVFGTKVVSYGGAVIVALLGILRMAFVRNMGDGSRLYNLVTLIQFECFLFITTIGMALFAFMARALTKMLREQKQKLKGIRSSKQTMPSSGGGARVEDSTNDRQLSVRCSVDSTTAPPSPPRRPRPLDTSATANSSAAKSNEMDDKIVESRVIERISVVGYFSCFVAVFSLWLLMSVPTIIGVLGSFPFNFAMEVAMNTSGICFGFPVAYFIYNPVHGNSSSNNKGTSHISPPASPHGTTSLGSIVLRGSKHSSKDSKEENL